MPRQSNMPTIYGQIHELSLIKARTRNRSGFRIRAMRIKRKMTLETLATEANKLLPKKILHGQSISRIESDGQIVLVDTLIAISQVLDVNLDWLMGLARLSPLRVVDATLFPSRMEFVRYKRYIDLTDAVAATGVTPQTIRNIEDNKIRLKEMHLVDFCEHYEISPYRLSRMIVPSDSEILLKILRKNRLAQPDHFHLAPVQLIEAGSISSDRISSVTPNKSHP